MLKYVYTLSRALSQGKEVCFVINCSFRHSFDGAANFTSGDKPLTSISLKSGSVIFIFDDSFRRVEVKSKRAEELAIVSALHSYSLYNFLPLG